MCKDSETWDCYEIYLLGEIKARKSKVWCVNLHANEVISLEKCGAQDMAVK